MSDPQDDDPQLSIPIEEVAFDEMNLVEIPFALLTNGTQRGLRRLPLSELALRTKGLPSTQRGAWLVAGEGASGLPTALAERVVLGLMALTKVQNGFQRPDITFSLRDLVCNYVFPGRSYRPSQTRLTAVEEQIHRVAHTRLISDRWFDKEKGETVNVDLAIIDHIKTPRQQHPRSPRVITIRWGDLFFKSVRDQYTKRLDFGLYQKLDGLEGRLYRLLDRQLAQKRVQTYRCQGLARFKLGMTGAKIERGGRTASSYIVEKLERALHRLNEVGFGVTMTVDKSRADHLLSFERHDNRTTNEVVEIDHVGDLICEFRYHFHSVAREAARGRLRKADRETAERWLADFGYEKAAWMVARCKKLHAANPRRAGETIYYLAGLEPYESAAAGAHDAEMVEREGQLKLDLEEHRGALWKRYRQVCLELAAEKIDSEDMQRQAERIARETSPESFRLGSPRIEKALVAEARETLVMQRIGALSEDEFRAAAEVGTLDAVLVERHGTNPLAASSNDPD